MDLADIYKKQQQNIDTFNATRDKIWKDMKERHDSMAAAFGSNENIPKEYATEMQDEQRRFNEEWSVSHGFRYADMIEQHEKQLAKATGKPLPSEQTKTNDFSTNEREKRKQEFIAEQKAISTKQQKQKHRPRF